MSLLRKPQNTFLQFTIPWKSIVFWEIFIEKEFSKRDLKYIFVTDHFLKINFF